MGSLLIDSADLAENFCHDTEGLREREFLFSFYIVSFLAFFLAFRYGFTIFTVFFSTVFFSLKNTVNF